MTESPYRFYLFGGKGERLLDVEVGGEGFDAAGGCSRSLNRGR